MKQRLCLMNFLLGPCITQNSNGTSQKTILVNLLEFVYIQYFGILLLLQKLGDQNVFIWGAIMVYVSMEAFYCANDCESFIVVYRLLIILFLSLLAIVMRKILGCICCFPLAGEPPLVLLC